MRTLDISLIQAPLAWEDKQANLNMFAKHIDKLPGGRLVVLPEMFNTGFTMHPAPMAEPMDGTTVHWMQHLAAKKNLAITGSMIVEDDGAYYNRMVWVQPNGVTHFYNKRHLFAFAGEHERYTPGHKKLTVQLSGFSISLQICYDLRFPVWARQPHKGELMHDVMIYVANWPAKRAHAWQSLLMARAIENQCYVLGVNRTGTDGNGIAYPGLSTIIDPLGNYVHKPNGRKVQVIHATLQKQVVDEARNNFPFWKDADTFKIMS